MLAYPARTMTTRTMAFADSETLAPGPQQADPTIMAAIPPVGTLDEIAAQMTHGFWGGSSHRFNVAQGGTLTVNLTGITADARPVALAALATWSDVLGITFAEVTVGGQIKFDDLEIGTGAFSESEWGEDGFTIWATVNVSVARLGTGPGIMRGGLHTYIHEIGHALGLGHTAFANSGTAAATYPNDALWANDGSAISVMSYFDNLENSYYADQGFSYLLITTPQVADIIAVGNLYGLSTVTRTGDTTYGFNNTSGRPMYDAAAHPNIAYTVFDSGGIDTLDYSGFSSASTINLNQEAFSSIGGRVGNVVIARGTVIENAIGGFGADVLTGNAADNILTGNAASDTLTGGAGADTFRDTAAGLNGDTIVDFLAGDRIVITNASLGTFAFSLSGNTLTFGGGSLTLANVPAGTITATAAAGGGVQLTVSSFDVASDFNGDARSDIMWRHDDGTVMQWLGQANGSFVTSPATHAMPTDWSVAGIGDFNGDNRDDVVWRHDSGVFMQWLGQASGGFAASNATYAMPGDWSVSGTGDFNGDGRDDVVWRHDSGVFYQWIGQANGSFASSNATYAMPTDWSVAGNGDFNGDGRDDVVWRHESGTFYQWMGQADGSFAASAAVYAMPTDWSVLATGDFNGDGRDDVVWLHEDGAFYSWMGQANGSFAASALVFGTSADMNVVSTGDFNGDGRDDILWRSDAGTVSPVFGQADGGWEPSGNFYEMPPQWHVQPADIWG